MDDRAHPIDRDVAAWVDPGGGIMLKCVTPEGDPVELSAAQARLMAVMMLDLIDEYDAHRPPSEAQARRWDDPVTGEERLRIDTGHVDRVTGKPFNNERAATDHTHLYSPEGMPIGDPTANDDKHLPIQGDPEDVADH